MTRDDWLLLDALLTLFFPLFLIGLVAVVVIVTVVKSGDE